MYFSKQKIFLEVQAKELLIFSVPDKFLPNNLFTENVSHCCDLSATH